MPELSPATQKLIQTYQESRLPPEPEGATIHVDEIASKVAALYEKIRKIVDWKEEHLMRQAAIERAMKRRMLSELFESNLTFERSEKARSPAERDDATSNLKAEEIAEPLVMELIRGGHLPNDKIPQSKIGDVQKVLEKYIYLLKNSPASGEGTSSKPRVKIQLYNWLLGIAACEIEETLDPSVRQNALINYMTGVIERRIRVNPSDAITAEEKRVQTYIAVHQALFHLDAPIISYHLLRYRYPQWANPPEPLLREIAQNIYAIWESLENELSHPLNNWFFEVCERYDTVYLLLGDVLKILSEASVGIAEKISELRALENLVKRAYSERLATLKSRLHRAAVYSTLSIFLASGLSLFIVEVPLARLFYGRFSPFAIAVDILAPTFLMFLLVLLVRTPRETNLEKVIAETKKTVYQGEKEDIYEIRIRKKKGILVGIISIIYILLCCLSLAATAWGFYLSSIPPTSIILDTVNVVVIVAAALVIRQRAKELVVEERITFWSALLDILSVPAAKVGQWLSARWKEYNVLSVFFTALIDMPLLMFIEFIESWNLFLREKKAEIR